MKTLKELRETKGITQEAAAGKNGAPLRTYIRWESGNNQPSAKYIPGLRKLFGSDETMALLEQKEGA